MVGDAGRRELKRQAAEEGAQAGEALARLAAAQGLGSCEIVVQQTPVFDALAGAVAATLPDLLVMGTRAPGPLGRVMLGSVAEQALRSFTCDVLVVPPAP